MGIVIGLAAVAIGVSVHFAGGLVGLGVRLLVLPFTLLAHPLPIILIVAGIIWLVKGANHGSMPAAKTYQGEATPSPAPGRLP